MKNIHILQAAVWKLLTKMYLGGLEDFMALGGTELKERGMGRGHLLQEMREIKCGSV